LIAVHIQSPFSDEGQGSAQANLAPVRIEGGVVAFTSKPGAAMVVARSQPII
jgi:hypothetical protein